MDRPRIELFTSAMPARSPLSIGGMVKVCVGSETVVLTAGEWSRLLANPQRADILASEAEGA